MLTVQAKKLVATTALIAVLAMSILGIASMHTQANSASLMGGCPISPGMSTALCPMSVADHIATWHSIFSVTIPLVAWLLLGVVAMAAVYSFNDIGILWLPQLEHYRRREPDKELFSYLRVAFQRGIIHPKLFA